MSIFPTRLQNLFSSAAFRVTLGAVGLLSLGACARHSEEAIRNRLSTWFSVGETSFFRSQMGCSAGLFKAQSETIKSALPIEDNTESALFDLRQSEAVGLLRKDRSPDDWFIEVMNADRPTGVAVQGAAVRAKACMSADIRALFQKALRRKGALFLYDRKLKILVLFDVNSRKILISGGNR